LSHNFKHLAVISLVSERGNRLQVFGNTNYEKHNFKSQIQNNHQSYIFNPSFWSIIHYFSTFAENPIKKGCQSELYRPWSWMAVNHCIQLVLYRYRRPMLFPGIKITRVTSHRRLFYVQASDRVIFLAGQTDYDHSNTFQT